MSFIQIGLRLGISRASVWHGHRRAMEKLRVGLIEELGMAEASTIAEARKGRGDA